MVQVSEKSQRPVEPSRKPLDLKRACVAVDQIYKPQSIAAYQDSPSRSVEKYSAVKTLLKEGYAPHWNADILLLPNIDLAGPIDDTRFKLDHTGSIPMTNRAKLVREYVDIKQRLTYVDSTRGIGKSYLLYILAARSMTDGKLRVVYINQVNAMVETRCIEVLTTILTADKKLFKNNNQSERWRQLLEQSAIDLESDFEKKFLVKDEFMGEGQELLEAWKSFCLQELCFMRSGFLMVTLVERWSQLKEGAALRHCT